jgi:hypothetical protein
LFLVKFEVPYSAIIGLRMTVVVTNLTLITAPRQGDGVIHKKKTPMFDTVTHPRPSKSSSARSAMRVLQQTPSYRNPHNQLSPMNVPTHKSPQDSRAITATLLPDLLSACHDLDLALCASTPSSHPAIKIWHTLDPLTYFSTPVIVEQWKADLTTLCQQYKDGFYSSHSFEIMLRNMLPAVDKLEESRSMLGDCLGKEREGFGDGDNGLEVVWEGVERRCRVLEEAFRGLDREF